MNVIAVITSGSPRPKSLERVQTKNAVLHIGIKKEKFLPSLNFVQKHTVHNVLHKNIQCITFCSKTRNDFSFLNEKKKSKFVKV